MNENKRRTRVPAKRRCKVRMIAQPIPTTPTPTTTVNSTPTVPTPPVSTSSTNMPVEKSAAASIPVMVHNLAKEKFDEVPYPSEIPQVEENPSIHNSNPPPLEAITNTQVREDTPWTNTIPASTNLFEVKAGWPVPPTPAPSVKVENTETPPQIAVIPHGMVRPKQAEEKYTWGLHCPISQKEEEEGTEDWNGNRQRATQKSQSTKCTAPPNL